MYDVASREYPGTPEEAARALLNENASLFGLTELDNVRVFGQRQAPGGRLFRFRRVFNGVAVSDGGTRTEVGAATSGGTLTNLVSRLFRFTVNPITRSITFVRLD